MLKPQYSFLAKVSIQSSEGSAFPALHVPWKDICNPAHSVQIQVSSFDFVSQRCGSYCMVLNNVTEICVVSTRFLPNNLALNLHMDGLRKWRLCDIPANFCRDIVEARD